MSVRIDNDLKEWFNRTGKQKLERSMLRLSSDVVKTSQILNPVDTGELKDSTRYERTGELQYRVLVDVPYARRRHFENFKNPHTRLYLQRAVEKNSRNLERYF